MSVEQLPFRRAISAGLLAGLGLLATGCEDGPQYETVERCDIVDDRLATTGSKIDGARFFFGDGNITTVPDDKYMIHTPTHGTVEVEADEYLNFQVGKEYCDTEEVLIESTSQSE